MHSDVKSNVYPYDRLQMAMLKLQDMLQMSEGQRQQNAFLRPMR